MVGGQDAFAKADWVFVRIRAADWDEATAPRHKPERFAVWATL